jgi:hypothetical protein
MSQNAHPFVRGTSCENVELFRNYLFQMLRFKRKLQGSENAENAPGLGWGGSVSCPALYTGISAVTCEESPM